MKYIITENRLNKVIFKYLDDRFEGVEQFIGSNYDIVFKLPNEEYGILGWEKSGTLYILNQLVDDISNLFGLDDTDSETVISKYVEDTYNLKVSHTKRIYSKRWYFS